MQHVSLAPIDFVTRLFLALGLGALIGLERQVRNHEGGLKTNALVAMGSAMFVMMAGTFGTPDRIVGQILPGIGFLGAGMIMRDGMHVRGLNTAATFGRRLKRDSASDWRWSRRWWDSSEKQRLRLGARKTTLE